MFIGFSEAELFLRNCEDAVIITHRNPDGDCIGAGFGLKDILAQMGIRRRLPHKRGSRGGLRAKGHHSC